MCPLGRLGKKFSSKQIYTCIPKPTNGVRLHATLERMNPTGLPVGAVIEENVSDRHSEMGERSGICFG